MMDQSGVQVVNPLPGRHLAAPISFRRLLGRPLRVGGINYLNSRPLLEALPASLGQEIEIENHPPGELASRLRSGALDIALVPVAEFFTGPPEYRIVPGISISSYGPVGSIRLYHRMPLQEVREVGLDSSSMTSSLLVRLLFSEEWIPAGPGPRFVRISPEEARLQLAAENPGFDAILLIGDEALVAPPGRSRRAGHGPDRIERITAGAHVWDAQDLGTVWTRLTGLPFVYAFWVYRGPHIPGLGEAFRLSRDLGRARIDQIVETYPLPSGLSPAAARRYLCQQIQHDLGPAQIEGLLEFRRRARARGILEISGPGDLRFTDAGENRP